MHQKRELRRLQKRDPLLNQIFDKGIIRQSHNQEVTALEMVATRNFKSANQIIVNTVAIVATNDSVLSAYDMGGNLLDLISIPEHFKVVSLSSSPSVEDAFIAVLTNTSDLLLYRLVIKDIVPSENKTNLASIGVSKGSQAHKQY